MTAQELLPYWCCDKLRQIVRRSSHEKATYETHDTKEEERGREGWRERESVCHANCKLYNANNILQKLATRYRKLHRNLLLFTS